MTPLCWSFARLVKFVIAAPSFMRFAAGPTEDQSNPIARAKKLFLRALSRRSDISRGGCKIISLPFFRILCFIFAHPASDKEGRFAIVTSVGRGMRWTLSPQLTSEVGSGRRSRVVLIPRRWDQVCG
jgi:hypothetical protein